MSTEAPSVSVSSQVRSRRAIRFGVGVTLASAIAYAIGFKLPFLVPILAGLLLSPTARCPSAKTGLGFVLFVAIGVHVGAYISIALLRVPAVFLLVQLLVIFLLYYWMWRGGPKFLILWLLLGLLVVPIMSFDSLALGVAIADGISMGAAIAIGSVWLTFGLIPDPPSPENGSAAAKSAASPPPKLPPNVCARKALTSCLVVFPILILVFVLRLEEIMLILIYTAILSMQASLTAGFKGGIAMIVSTVIGGVAAIVMFNLVVALHNFWFYILLILLFGLCFGVVMNAGRRLSPFMGSAFNTVMILVGTTATNVEATAAASFYSRFAFVMLAVLWVVAAFAGIESFKPRRVVTA